MSTALLDKEQNSEQENGNKEFENPKKAPVYVDIRTPQEFEAMHIEGARNIPLPDLHQYRDELKALSQERSIILMCRTQNRVKIAYEYLTNNGVSNCHILEGGITAWVSQGNPLLKGKKEFH